MTRRLRHDEKANQDQLESVRQEMLEYVDYVCKCWPTIQKQAREMGRGFGSSSLGAIGSGGASRVELEAERTIDDGRVDPAQRALDWLSLRAEAFGHLKSLAASARRLMPTSPEELKKQEEEAAKLRGNEICVECGLPAVEGDIKRWNNEVYHRTASRGRPSCYWQAYNRVQGRRGA